MTEWRKGRQVYQRRLHFCTRVWRTDIFRPWLKSLSTYATRSKRENSMQRNKYGTRPTLFVTDDNLRLLVIITIIHLFNRKYCWKRKLYKIGIRENRTFIDCSIQLFLIQVFIGHSNEKVIVVEVCIVLLTTDQCFVVWPFSYRLYGMTGRSVRSGCIKTYPS